MIIQPILVLVLLLHLLLQCLFDCRIAVIVVQIQCSTVGLVPAADGDAVDDNHDNHGNNDNDLIVETSPDENTSVISTVTADKTNHRKQKR